MISAKYLQKVLAVSYMEQVTLSEIARKTGITFSYTLDSVKLIEDKNLLISNKTGRCRYVKITDKGVTTLDYLNNLFDLCEDLIE